MSPAVLVLFTRALTLDSRNFTTYLGRMGLVFIIIFVLVWAHASVYMVGGAPGLGFFTGLLWVTLLFASLVSIFLFSTVITEEKEEMTLGLLKMTGLNPLSIVLGKGASRIISAVLLLLAQFPFTLLAITLGGVSMDQILAGYCTMVSYLLLLGALGLFSSVWCRRSATAMMMTGLALVVFLALPWPGQYVLDEAVSAGQVVKEGVFCVTLTAVFNVLKEASPLVRVTEITTTGFAEGPIGFQVLSNLGAAVFFFLVSWAIFERATGQEKSPAPSRWLLFTRRSRLAGLGVGRAWSNALAWKEFHFGTGGIVFFVLRFLAMAALFALVGFFIYNSYTPSSASMPARELGDFVMVLSLIFGCLDLVAQAARTFNTEWRGKTLPDIMILPMTTSKLVWQKIAGCLLVGIPYLVLFVIGAALSPRDFADVASLALFSVEGWLILFEAIFLLYLTAYMSLQFKWMGLPLALAVGWLGNSVAYGVFALSFGGMVGGSIMMCVTVIFFSALLHTQILRLLERRCGE